jgi:ribosomal protein S4
METQLTFDQLLESIDRLPIDQQATLIEILERRMVELRRQQIAQHAAEARQLYIAGKLPLGNVDDLLADLNSEDA